MVANRAFIVLFGLLTFFVLQSAAVDAVTLKYTFNPFTTNFDIYSEYATTDNITAGNGTFATITVDNCIGCAAGAAGDKWVDANNYLFVNDSYSSVLNITGIYFGPQIGSTNWTPNHLNITGEFCIDGVCNSGTWNATVNNVQDIFAGLANLSAINIDALGYVVGAFNSSQNISDLGYVLGGHTNLTSGDITGFGFLTFDNLTAISLNQTNFLQNFTDTNGRIVSINGTVIILQGNITDLSARLTAANGTILTNNNTVTDYINALAATHLVNGSDSNLRTLAVTNISGTNASFLNLSFTNLVSCTALEVDANGYVQCGVDDTSSGAFVQNNTPAVFTSVNATDWTNLTNQFYGNISTLRANDTFQLTLIQNNNDSMKIYVDDVTSVFLINNSDASFLNVTAQNITLDWLFANNISGAINCADIFGAASDLCTITSSIYDDTAVVTNMTNLFLNDTKLRNQILSITNGTNEVVNGSDANLRNLTLNNATLDYLFATNLSGSVDCADIYGGSDADFCADADTGGGGGGIKNNTPANLSNLNVAQGLNVSGLLNATNLTVNSILMGRQVGTEDVGYCFGHDPDTCITSPGIGIIRFYADGVLMFQFLTSGLNNMLGGTAGNPSFKINDSVTGFYAPQSSSLAIVANAVEYITLNETGDRELIINKNLNDMDFIIHSSGLDSAFLVNGSTGEVSIKHNTTVANISADRMIANNFTGSVDCSDIFGTTSDLCTITASGYDDTAVVTNMTNLFLNDSFIVTRINVLNTTFSTNITTLSGRSNSLNTSIIANNLTVTAYIDAQDALQDECSEITNCHPDALRNNSVAVFLSVNQTGNQTNVSINLGQIYDLDALLAAGENITITQSGTQFTIDAHPTQAGIEGLGFFTGADTNITAGNGIDITEGIATVAGNTCLDQDADGLSVTADCIGNTQLQFDTGQALTTTSEVVFTGVNTTFLNATWLKGDGGNITHLNGDVITFGTVADARIASTLSRDTESVAAGDISGSLSTGYTIDAGAVQDAEIDYTVVELDDFNNVPGFIGVANLSGINLNQTNFLLNLSTLRNNDNVLNTTFAFNVSNNRAMINSIYNGSNLTGVSVEGGDLTGSFPTLNYVAGSIQDAEIDYNAVTMADLTNDAGLTVNGSDANFRILDATNLTLQNLSFQWLVGNYSRMGNITILNGAGTPVCSEGWNGSMYVKQC